MENNLKEIYLEQLKKYQTKEEKKEYLETCKFNIDMIDRWTRKDEEAYDIVSDLLKQLESGELK